MNLRQMQTYVLVEKKLQIKKRRTFQCAPANEPIYAAYERHRYVRANLP